MALPVMSPLLAVFLAVPILRLPPEIIIVEMVRRLIAPVRDGLPADRHRLAGASHLRAPQRRRPNRLR